VGDWGRYGSGGLCIGGAQRNLTPVTSTGDWQQTGYKVVYSCVDGGLCGAAEKEFSSRCRMCRKGRVKNPAFLFSPCSNRKTGLVAFHKSHPVLAVLALFKTG
jgi:hypothetical protein